MSIQLIRRAVPEADEAIVEYIEGYLRENDFEEDEDAIVDFVKPILLDAGGEEAKIDELCLHLSSLIMPRENKRGLSKLEHSVQMSQQNALSATASLTRSNADLEHVSGRRVQSQVNQDKLRKAEAKIASKMLKRQEKSNMKVEYEASRLLDEQKALQEQYKMYNPILDYTTTKGKNKDIKVENFDISFAGRRILTDANLTLAFGRRYGVVGKNGIGKSTLLKAMARREIAVPQHISLLYVEQEVSRHVLNNGVNKWQVVGDDTPAVEMVLRADVWREHLLEKERDISARMAAIDSEQAREDVDEGEKTILESERNKLNTELQEVFTKLSDIESDKAESKASAILAGLGFGTDQQKRPTREFSGGWRMRISLARALFCKPDVLMLDEPDNMLDVSETIDGWFTHRIRSLLLYG